MKIVLNKEDHDSFTNMLSKNSPLSINDITNKKNISSKLENIDTIRDFDYENMMMIEDSANNSKSLNDNMFS